MVLEPTRFRVPPEYIDPNRMDADAAERSPVRLSIPKAKTLLPIPRPGNTIMYLMPQGTPGTPGQPSSTPTRCWVFLNEESAKPIQLRPGEVLFAPFAKAYVTTYNEGNGVDLLIGYNAFVANSETGGVVLQQDGSLYTRFSGSRETVTVEQLTAPDPSTQSSKLYGAVARAGLLFFYAPNVFVSAGSDISNRIVKTGDVSVAGPYLTPAGTTLLTAHNLKSPFPTHFIGCMKSDQDLMMAVEQSFDNVTYNVVNASGPYAAAGGTFLLSGPVGYPYFRLRFYQAVSNAFNFSGYFVLGAGEVPLTVSNLT